MNNGKKTYTTIFLFIALLVAAQGLKLFTLKQHQKLPETYALLYISFYLVNQLMHVFPQVDIFNS